MATIECKNCELAGYSEELCGMHRRHCIHELRKDSGGKKLGFVRPIVGPLKEKTPHFGMKTLIGVGAGSLAVAGLVVTAPILGAHVLVHSIALKISAGVAGGGFGFWSFKRKKNKEKHRET